MKKKNRPGDYSTIRSAESPSQAAIQPHALEATETKNVQNANFIFSQHGLLTPHKRQLGILTTEAGNNGSCEKLKIKVPKK